MRTGGNVVVMNVVVGGGIIVVEIIVEAVDVNVTVVLVQMVVP